MNEQESQRRKYIEALMRAQQKQYAIQHQRHSGLIGYPKTPSDVAKQEYFEAHAMHSQMSAQEAVTGIPANTKWRTDAENRLKSAESALRDVHD